MEVGKYKNNNNSKHIPHFTCTICDLQGFSHLTFNRVDFQAQVSGWVSLSKDLVVILFGIAEIILDLELVHWENKPAQLE
jgi:hypothetical protein